MSDRKDGVTAPTLNENIAKLDHACAEALRIAEKHVCRIIGNGYVPSPNDIGSFARKMLDALLSEREGGGV